MRTAVGLWFPGSLIGGFAARAVGLHGIVATSMLRTCDTSTPAWRAFARPEMVNHTWKNREQGPFCDHPYEALFCPRRVTRLLDCNDR